MVVKKIVFLIVLLFSSIAYAQYEHVFYTGDQFSVKWDAGTDALGYEWRIQRVSDSVVIREGETTELTVSTSISSAGLYVFYIRSWNYYQVTPPDRTYSVWVNSLTHGKVDGVIRAWQIKINLRQVGPLLFFDEL